MSYSYEGLTNIRATARILFQISKTQPPLIANVSTSKAVSANLPTKDMTAQSGMTPWPEELLNKPEQLLKDIKDSQAIIKAHTDLIAMRKKDLDDHLANGTIEKEFKCGDLSAKLVERRGSYDYKECPEVQRAMRKAEIDKTAKRRATIYSWRIF